MDATFNAQSYSDHAATVQAADTRLRQSKAPIGTRAFDDDYWCAQRNSAPPPDGELVRAIANLDN